MKEVPLANTSLVALVDDDDFARVSEHPWRLAPWGKSRQKVYARAWVKIDGRWKSVVMHRFIMGLDSPRLDHMDGNGLNNQRSNLRPATKSQNGCNRGPVRGLRFKGVSWQKRLGKWQAAIGKDYRREYIGIFADAEEAARAYDKRAKELHGEFAWLNFPV